ncbi:adult-specific rigid cuticular protein 15.7-like [Galendromus occidentalis]|uniref:Adult-specific rigid cuticular protein 15.7-like n=1 Tax=Galendromus occidentalis TaxID=34638 RepID=A0AAJ6QZ66_9ACAR|nr:adult-specific rigid cuticular protein 15.7-like [Galendromus occidentalis]
MALVLLYLKALLCVVALCAAVAAAIPHGGGHSNSFRKQDDHGNYAFGYDIKNGYGAVNGRKESGSHGAVVGSYYIGDVDGRHRSVHYVADKLGFRAQIKTNEPGTKTSYAAAAVYDSANGKAPVALAYGAPYGAYGGYGGYGAYGAPGPFYG